MRTTHLLCLALGMLIYECATSIDERHKAARRQTRALLQRVMA